MTTTEIELFFFFFTLEKKKKKKGHRESCGFLKIIKVS